MKKLISILLLLIIFKPGVQSQELVLANSDRIESRILALASFGADADGGISRHAFSVADLKAREHMIVLMKEAGLIVRIDEAGNIIGRREGKDHQLSVICFGSHIDTVPSGGKFDGVAGVLVALETIELLNTNKIVTNHPLEIIIFSDEEGGTVGSKALLGILTEKDLKLISNSGKTIGDGIQFIGGDPNKIEEAKRNSKEFKAFLELHIEQGAFLDNEGIKIGIVEGIVGIETWLVDIYGKANHAGTTPMDIRQDALIAASKLIIAVNETVKSVEGRQVGTVGEIMAEPGASNVIPGHVKISIELRDLSQEKTLSIFERIKQKMAGIEKETGTRIEYFHEHSNLPAIMNKDIQYSIEQSAKELGLSYKFMPSGAGHDAQNMAKITPTGMIFIPSIGGISHSPKERSRIEDITNGANVFFKTILAIDRN